MRAENYNPHLDVLRAIAVMAVCFYHLPESEFSYGWLGVDIFFVLSGYLIIGQILRQIEEGRFSVRNFLQRRVRRILPGLLVVLATSSIVAFYLFQGVYLKNFSENLFGALIGASNFTLWKQNNYFDTANALKPLLHTWSLGLEAQFYVVIPVCLVALKYIKLDAKSFLVLATMFSLSLAAYGFYSYPSPTFFLLPTRAWEFLAGGMVFVLLRKPDISIGSQYVLNFSTLAIIGIFFGGLMIFGGIVTLLQRW